jgi:hypothetical protein
VPCPDRIGLPCCTGATLPGSVCRSDLSALIGSGVAFFSLFLPFPGVLPLFLPFVCKLPFIFGFCLFLKKCRFPLRGFVFLLFFLCVAHQ